MTDQTKTIPRGYKQTEVGVIPDDWDVVTYGQAFNFLRTASYSRDQLTDKEQVGYVHYGDIHVKWNHIVDLEKTGLPSIENSKVKNYGLVKDGDLIMADASEDYEGVGKSVEVKNIKDKKVISGLHTFLLRSKPGFFENGFKGYIHSNKLVKSILDRYATGMKVFGVSKTNLKLVYIPKPPSPEQTAIASILSDTDALITSLEKLIAKKRAVKQGAMQELLTGKRRLPGFSGGWVAKNLGEVADYKNGKSFERYITDSGDYYLITLNSLDIKGKFKNEHLRVNFIDKSLNKNDLIMILSDVAHGNFLGLTDVIPEDNKYVLNQRVGALKNIRYIAPHYLSKYINLNQKYFKTAGQGSSQQNLAKGDILNFEIKFPKLLEEQTAISTVLFDMDSEIEALEHKLTKYKRIKIGMMQNLLTGKIRVYEKQK